MASVMQMPALAALVLLLPAVLIGIWVAWNDMKFMKIPNLAVLALTAVFVVLGPIALPFDTYLWQLSHLPMVLVVGFVLNLAGAIGAGDAKFAAAMAPFFATGDLRLVMALAAAMADPGLPPRCRRLAKLATTRLSDGAGTLGGADLLPRTGGALWRMMPP